MRILVVDDEKEIRELVRDVLIDDGYEVDEASDGKAAIDKAAAQRFDLVFCDVKMAPIDGFAVLREFRETQPQAEVILMTGHGSLEAALEAVREGAVDYICKPFEIDDVSAMARAALDRQRLKREPNEARAEAMHAGDEPEFSGLIGRSPAMIEILKTVGRIAPTNLPVLICGESGTGKEVIARTIHQNSLRATKPFIAVNCGALTETLLETELFGHVRGAFTGAQMPRRGLFEEADGGTLLLDEITETSPAFQVKLLRVLQENEVKRVGANIATRVNVRVIATTNRDPEKLVENGFFRQDLLYRLNVITLTLPPLRDRQSDIHLMIESFIKRYTQPGRSRVRVSAEALRVLENYRWPGNVRELRHTIQRLTVLNSGGVIRLEDIPPRLLEGDGSEEVTEIPIANGSSPMLATTRNGKMLTWAEVEQNYLHQVLRETHGNKKQAAEIMGIDRKTLSRMVDRYQINLDLLKGNS
ncbi:MAG TPA: sigma-54 dependent transcriptional regulator [Blastocatellia bacterium]|nr:sigma-54 dependent transcriptional regulator [Blastocatellia bacterium]